MFGSSTKALKDKIEAQKARIDQLAAICNQLHSRIRRGDRQYESDLRDRRGTERELLDRLARLEAKIEMLAAAPRAVAGVGSPDGFQSFRAAIEAESDTEQEPDPDPRQKWATGFANRINEIWNDGVSVEELQHRQREWLRRTTKTQPTTDEEEAD